MQQPRLAWLDAYAWNPYQVPEQYSPCCRRAYRLEDAIARKWARIAAYLAADLRLRVRQVWTRLDLAGAFERPEPGVRRLALRQFGELSRFP